MPKVRVTVTNVETGEILEELIVIGEVRANHETEISLGRAIENYLGMRFEQEETED